MICTGRAPAPSPTRPTWRLRPTRRRRLPPSRPAFNQNGSLIRLFGATAMAPLSRIVMEPGRVYRDRIAFSRAVDTPDLSNNAVRIGVVWFDQSGARDPARACPKHREGVPQPPECRRAA